MRSPKALVVLVAFALLLTACGDDGSETSTSTPPDQTSDVPADDGVGTPDGNADDGDMGDGDLPDEVVPSTDALIDPYCSVSAQADARAAAFDSPTATPAEVEEFYRSMLALTEDGLVTVPDAVAGALAVQRDVLLQVIDVLEPAGWDLVASIDALEPIFASSEFLAADEELEAFDTSVCGFAPDNNTGDTPPPVEEPVEVPAEYAAYCAAAFAAAQADNLAPDADAAAVEAFYRGLLARLDELVRLSPPELEADLATIRSTFLEFVALFETVEWEPDAGFDLVGEWASDPLVSDPLDAAIERVEAFDEAVCGTVY